MMPDYLFIPLAPSLQDVLGWLCPSAEAHRASGKATDSDSPSPFGPRGGTNLASTSFRFLHFPLWFLYTHTFVNMPSSNYPVFSTSSVFLGNLGNFYHDWCWILSDGFSASVEMILRFLSFVNRVYNIDFQMLN